MTHYDTLMLTQPAREMQPRPVTCDGLDTPCCKQAVKRVAIDTPTCVLTANLCLDCLAKLEAERRTK